MPTALLNDAAETGGEQGDEWAELVSVQGAIVQAEEALARSTLMQTARLNEAAETEEVQEVQEEREVQDDEDEEEGEYVGLPSFNTEAGRSWVHTRAGGWTFQESQVLILSNPGRLGLLRDTDPERSREVRRDRSWALIAHADRHAHEEEPSVEDRTTLANVREEGREARAERSERQRERLSEITAAREALEAQMEEGEITEGRYLERMNALRNEYGAVLSRVDRR